MAPKRVRTVEGSCWPCKDRRVICDLQRPHCSRCAAEGQPCGYGKVRLRWCNGVAARGRFAGQNLPVSDSDDDKHEDVPSDERLAIKPESPWAKTDESEDGEEEDEGGGSTTSTVLTLRTHDTFTSASARTAESLMLYFEHEVVDRFNLSSGPIPVDLLSIYKDPALLQSVTAVANAHHSFHRRLSHGHAALEKKKARLSAIQVFRKKLRTNPPSSLDTFDLFVTNVLFCILDGVIDPDDEGAATFWHYRGGKAILSQGRIQERLFAEKRGLPALMLSVFATMDLTYALLSGQGAFFHHSTWTNFAGSDGWWGIMPAGDPFLDIMATLSQFAHMGHLMRDGSMLPSPSELLVLLKALQGYDAVDPLEGDDFDPFPAVQPTSPLAPSLMNALLPTHTPLSHEESWIVFCIAYRLTGLLYVYRVVYGLDVTHPLVQQVTGLGVHAICGSQLMGKLSHCLLFPALVIGSHCRNPLHQKMMQITMNSTASFLYFGSLRIMDHFLQEVWERNSATETWWECFEPISRKAFLF